MRLSELRDVPFIDHPSGWATRMSTDRAFADARVQRSVAFEVADTTSVLDLVRHGLGIAILPPSLVPDTNEVRIVPIRGRSPVWEISLATPANRPMPAAARAFADAAT